MHNAKLDDKEYIKAVCCNPIYLTYLQSTSRIMPSWMKHKLESRLQGEISITWDKQDMHTTLMHTWDMHTNLMAESEKELKSLLMKVKEESKKLA